jgi:hypothetical protein
MLMCVCVCVRTQRGEAAARLAVSDFNAPDIRIYDVKSSEEPIATLQVQYVLAVPSRETRCDCGAGPAQHCVFRLFAWCGRTRHGSTSHSETPSCELIACIYPQIHGAPLICMVYNAPMDTVISSDARVRACSTFVW